MIQLQLILLFLGLFIVLPILANNNQSSVNEAARLGIIIVVLLLLRFFKGRDGLDNFYV
jgi:uncharacterized membrane protein